MIKKIIKGINGKEIKIFKPTYFYDIDVLTRKSHEGGLDTGMQDSPDWGSKESIKGGRQFNRNGHLESSAKDT